MNNITLALKVSDFKFDPKEITDLVGLTPFRFFLEGEDYFIGPPHNRIPKIRESNYWEYRIHISNNNVWTKTVIDSFVKEVIEEKRTGWLKIKNDISIELYIGVQYHSLDELDSYHFDQGCIKLLSDLSMEIDVDQGAFCG
jgi:hypothetical protein